MDKMRKKFRDIFQENDKEELELLHDVEVKGEKFSKGDKFSLQDELGGVNFHKYRYLDLAVETIDSGKRLRLVGFYPAKKV